MPAASSSNTVPKDRTSHARDVDRLRLHDQHGRLPSAHLRAAYPPHLPRDAHTDDRHEKHKGREKNYEIIPNRSLDSEQILFDC